MKITSFSNNSFDLIRLFAATQVAFCHTVDLLSPQYTQTFWYRFLELFPGVPIFFFISGFLISRSYEKNSNIKEYAINRALRIFPALHVCVLFNIFLVAATGYLALASAGFGDILLLYIAKTTILQFYNPDFMRGFGDGVLNGSLWTICVELQFYILVPVLYTIIGSTSKKQANIILLCLVAVFLIFNRSLFQFQHDYGKTVYYKLAWVSFFTWFYMFLVGVIFQRNFDFFCKLAAKVNVIVLLVSFMVYSMLVSNVRIPYMMNDYSPLVYFPLAFVVFCMGYSSLTRFAGLLRKNDISYGVYIYHMTIANMFIYYKLTDTFYYALLIIISTFLLAVCSWFLLEKPILRLKRHPLNSLVNQT